MKKIFILFILFLTGCAAFQPKDGMTYAEFERMAAMSMNGRPINLKRDNEYSVYVLPSVNRDLKSTNLIAAALYDPNKDLAYIFNIRTNLLVKTVSINEVETVFQELQNMSSQGFGSKSEYDFSKYIQADSKQIQQFKKLGITTPYDYEIIKLEEVKVKDLYENQTDTASVLLYAQDKDDARKKNLTLTQYIKIRKTENEKQKIIDQKNEQIRQANLKKQQQEYAKEFPFTAILSCSFGQNSQINIMSCFSGEYTKTQLEIRNGNTYGMFQMWELERAGQMTRDGLVISLSKSFEIKAQNASDNLILNLKVINNATNEVAFVKSVAKFGVISVRN